MKKQIIIVIFALLPLLCPAQSGDGLGVGLRAGINLADFTGSTGAGRAGFIGGVFVDYNIKRFGFELGFNYAQHGSLGVVQSGALNNSVDYMFDYVNAQLFFKYQIFNGFRVFAGPQVSYLVDASQKEGDLVKPINYISQWDVGMKAGVGFTFKFGLDVSASYSHGFFDIFQNSRTSYNSVFAITLGWRFSLNGKHKK